MLCLYGGLLVVVCVFNYNVNCQLIAHNNPVQGCQCSCSNNNENINSQNLQLMNLLSAAANYGDIQQSFPMDNQPQVSQASGPMNSNNPANQNYQNSQMGSTPNQQPPNYCASHSASPIVIPANFAQPSYAPPCFSIPYTNPINQKPQPSLPFNGNFEIPLDLEIQLPPVSIAVSEPSAPQSTPYPGPFQVPYSANYYPYCSSAVSNCNCNGRSWLPLLFLSLLNRNGGCNSCCNCGDCPKSIPIPIPIPIVVQYYDDGEEIVADPVKKNDCT